MTDDLHLTEEEQVERLKKWWKENGNAIIIGLAIGIGAIVGVNYWRNHQQQQAVNASNIYDNFIRAAVRNDQANLDRELATLRSEYQGTTYAALAALQQARIDVQLGKFDEAIKNLQWTVNNPGHASLAHIARIRLAEVLIAKNRVDEALRLIEKISEPAFDAKYAELRGDIFARLAKPMQAREAYQLALASNTLVGKHREFVQMKLDDLSLPETAQSKP